MPSVIWRAAEGRGGCRRGDDAAVVAEDEVAPGARVDRVAARAGDDHVRSAAGDDPVVAADRRCERLDERESGERRGRRSEDPGVVAGDHVAVPAGVDRVRARAADDDVVARVAVDRVRAPVRVADALDGDDGARGEQPAGARHLVDAAVVAEQDVGAGAAAQRVRAGGQGVAGRGMIARRGGVDEREDLRGEAESRSQVGVEAAVAVEVVVAALAADVVVAAAAREVVAVLAAVDGVVASAAVDRDRPRREPGVDDVGAGGGEFARAAGETARASSRGSARPGCRHRRSAAARTGRRRR
jgi:hypothetical protein